MADDLFGGEEAQSTPVDISDLVTVNPLPVQQLPLPATRNSAVTTALVADPGNGQEHYNTMMNEAQQGDTTTRDQLKQQAQDQTKATDFQTTAQLLADPNIPFEQKQKIVTGFSANRFLKDTGVQLQTNLLSKEGVNETPDTERARISTADALNEMAASRTQIQSIVNGFKDKADKDSNSSKFFDAAAGLIPFRNQVITAKVMEGLSNETGIPRAWWETFKTYAAPGNDIRNLQAHVASLPPDQQLSFAKALAKSVQNNTGFLYGNDNHQEAYEFMNKVFNTESYGGGSQFLDNTFALMDMAFLGSTARDIKLAATNVKQAFSGAKGPANLEEARMFQQANANTPSTARTEPTGSPSGVQNDIPEPNFGQTAQPAEKAFNPNAQPKQAATDVPFTETQNGNFHVEGVGPANQLPNPVPKLTAPVMREGEATPVAKQLAGTKSQAETVSETIGRIRVQSITHDINPASPAEIAQNSNPDTARAMHEAVVKGDDEVSNALTAVPRDQAIINNTIPQASDTGTVFTRTGDVDKNLRVESNDPHLVDLVNDTGVQGYSNAEKAAARAHIVNGFENNTGLQMNEAMSSFSHNGGRTKVSAVYELPAGSWADPEQAVNQAAHALRDFGIEPSDIQLLRKDGVNHVPVSLEDAKGVEGDYKIKIDTDMELNPSMLSNRDTLDVKRNWFDRFAGAVGNKRGSVTRYILDAASTLHPLITGSASVAKDYGARFEKYMLKKAAEYSDAYSSMSKSAQAKIDDYIREANFNGIAYDQADLAARGFNASEASVISKWRNFWDDHFYLENLDLVRTLRTQGYEYFKNANAELFARKIGKTPSVTRFYDPVSDTVRGFRPGELDDLYNQGGHLSALRRPTSINGQVVEHMIITQKPNSYSRALKDSDKVLNYKDGYYTITYKAAKFVDEVDAQGNKIRTLAVAGDTKEAEDFAARHMANNPGTLTRVRSDAKGLTPHSDEAWDINSTGGRTAQRHRGQLLEDAGAPNHLGDNKYIANPVESAVRAAKSISGRTVMRPMLENAAQRAMLQYERVFPKDRFGQVRWPANSAEIGALGEYSTKEVADARTTWEYLNFLRNGYINSIDDGWKAIWNSLADSAAGKGVSGGVERAIRTVGEAAPTTFVRRRVNDLLIASSPLRQLVVQSAASYRAITYNPIDYANGKVAQDLYHFLAGRYFGSKQGNDFTQFLDKTGLIAAVEHHNLTAATLTNLADQANIATRTYRYSLNKLRTIGFDAGESMNIVNHASAVFRRYERLGRDVKNKDVQEQMMGEIRALTYNMNAAGDMPYNSGTAAALFQFMQMPHKALLFFTNRQIDTATKIRMGIGDMLLWGISIDGLSNALNFDFLPRDDTAGNKIMHDGLISLGYNGLLKGLYEGTHDIDTSSLSPYGFDGWAKLFFGTVASGGGVFGAAMAAISNTPAGSSMSKIGQVYKDMSRLWAPLDDKETSYEKFQAIVSDAAKISSGWNNVQKALVMQEAGKRRDKFNSVTTDNTTTGDAIAQMFGFADRQTADNFALGKKLSKDIESNKQDVLSVYKDIKQYYANKYAGENTPDFQYYTAVTGLAMSVYKDDPNAMSIIQKQIHADISGPDQDLMYKMFQSMGIKGETDFETDLANGPWDENTKSQMRQAYKFAKDAQKDLTTLQKGNK